MGLILLVVMVMMIFKVQLFALIVIVVLWVYMAKTEASDEQEFVKWLVLIVWGCAMCTFAGSIVYGLATT